MCIHVYVRATDTVRSSSPWNLDFLARTILDSNNNNRKFFLPIWFTWRHSQSKTGKQVKFYYSYSFGKHLLGGDWEKPRPLGVSQMWDGSHILVVWLWGGCLVILNFVFYICKRQVMFLIASVAWLGVLSGKYSTNGGHYHYYHYYCYYLSHAWGTA